MQIAYTPIGYFHTPHLDAADMPIQPIGAKGVTGTIEILPAYIKGLRDLEGFSHVFVLYHLHEIQGYDLVVKPFLDDCFHGIFATRSPKRPNPIGLLVLRVIEVTDNSVYLDGVDVLDGTPVLDIKPYVTDFDQCHEAKTGWFEGKSLNAISKKSDSRFI